MWPWPTFKNADNSVRAIYSEDSLNRFESVVSDRRKIRFYALRDESGAIVKWCGAATDIHERILAERGRDAVLVSLARAGTPIGILVKRWAKFARAALDRAGAALELEPGRADAAVPLARLLEGELPEPQHVDGGAGG